MPTSERREREWTVMVYFAGENRLFDEMVYALKDIKSVATDSDLEVALLAEYSTEPVRPGASSTTRPPTPRRFNFITDHDHPAGLAASNLVKLHSTQQPKPEPFTLVDEIADFLVWGIREFPAHNYLVVFSGDGSGVLGDFLPSVKRPERKLKPKDLKAIFEKVRSWLPDPKFKVDVVGLDSCLMSMAEIAFLIRKYTDLLVGSQGNEDDLGWPYRDILSVLKCKPKTHPRRLAEATVEKYNSYYLDYAVIANASANLSAMDLTMVNGLTSAVSEFTRAANCILPEADVKEKYRCGPKDQLDFQQQIFIQLLVNAHWVAQTFRHDQFTDLYDFCDVVSRLASQMLEAHQNMLPDLGEVKEACELIKRVLAGSDACFGDRNGTVIISSCFVGVKYQHSHGLSIYFPWSEIDEEYFPGKENPHGQREPDEFALRTGWGDFLQRYVTHSRRCPRQTGGAEAPWRETVEDFLQKDPPEGRGMLGPECLSAKNPPSEWDINDCVVLPIQNR